MKLIVDDPTDQSTPGRDPMDYLRLLQIAMAPIVRRLPDPVSFEDLQAVAFTSLSNALNRVEVADVGHIEGWLVWKTRCGVVDELRRLDPLSRSTRNQLKAIRAAEERLAQSLSRDPTDSELADETKLPLNTVQAVRHLGSIKEVDISAMAGMPDDSAPDPADVALQSEEREMLRAAILNLPPRQAEVIHGIYFEHLTFAEIAAALGVSTPRVAHLRDQAIHNLQKVLGEKR